MKFEYNIWKYTYGRYKIYVDKKSVLNALMKIDGMTKQFTYYQRRYTVGWDLMFPTKQLDNVKKIIKEFQKNS